MGIVAGSVDVGKGALGWLPGTGTARRSPMQNSNRSAGIVEVDGLRFEWELRREPQWGETDGWQGMTIALRQQGAQRGAVLEFPPPKRLMKGMQRGRLQINDAILARGVRAARLAGWEPESRGKPMVFMVDAEGN
jgi:hypothetical protein